MRPLVYLLMAMALGGCSPALPPNIRNAPEVPISLAEAQQDPTRFEGRPVRWGGNILGVRNLATVTEIEVLARPLGSDGEPLADGATEGRFIAEVDGFLDPATYPEKHRLTVAGRFARMDTRRVGEYPYRYPILKTETLFLWTDPPPYRPYPRPGLWYDGWYYPGYGPWWYGPW